MKEKLSGLLGVLASVLLLYHLNTLSNSNKVHEIRREYSVMKKLIELDTLYAGARSRLVRAMDFLEEGEILLDRQKISLARDAALYAVDYFQEAMQFDTSLVRDEFILGKYARAYQIILEFDKLMKQV